MIVFSATYHIISNFVLFRDSYSWLGTASFLIMNTQFSQFINKQKSQVYVTVYTRFTVLRSRKNPINRGLAYLEACEFFWLDSACNVSIES